MTSKPPKRADPTLADLIVENATDSMVFTNPEGLTVWVNKPFVQMSGYDLSEMVGKKPGSLLQGPDTDPQTVAKIRAAVEARQTIRTEILNYTKDGCEYWIDLKITPIFDHDGRLTHFMSIERDVTEVKQLMRSTEAALVKEQERRRERKVLSQMSEWLFAAQCMEELQAVVARSMERLFPNTKGELFIYSNSRDILDRVSAWGAGHHPMHLQADECWGLRRGRAYSYGTSEIDFVCNHVDSENHPYFCLPIIAHGDTIGLLHITFLELQAHAEAAGRVCSKTAKARSGPSCEKTKETLSSALDLAQICAEQISLAAANVRLQTELQNRSVKDALTGLWNRRWFLDMANREIRRAQASGTPLSLVMLDVDHFKKFNDAHGHDAGDAVLKVLAAHMSDVGSESIFPCRIGGEEFVLICSNATAYDASSVVGNLRQRLSEAHIVYSGSALPGVTVSAGVAELSHHEDLQSLMKRADEALYAAKRGGRDRAVIAEHPGAGAETDTAPAKTADAHG